VLQPRVTPSLPVGREGSLFQRVFSSPRGMDPYAFAVSDVYQDLFGEGSYVGKGIYDVDAFEAALEGRIPESSVLSHDLLEGIFARAGLVTDVEFVEEFPSRYDVAVARQHRWARGDWQLLPWIFGHGRDASGSRSRAGIPLIGRWKMIDNLRRSLSAPAAFLAFVAGWTLPLRAAEIWTGFVLSTIVLPSLLPLVAGIVPRRHGFSKVSQLRSFGADLSIALIQIGFLITFLAHQAWLMADAVALTLFRLFVRRRRLLEWVTAAQIKLSRRPDFIGFVRLMGGAAALAVCALLVITLEGRTALIAVPFVLLWVLSPAVARWASLPPPVAGHLRVSVEDAERLRRIARRTWGFFEKFVTAEDHMLPPDNFQEDPKPVVAHRTSPTNMGLYLLSVVAARDFGWIGALETVERLEATLATMEALERFRGHFYNWYDTSDLRPLEPKYVSSVDSGNLAGHLIALANACQDLEVIPVASPLCLAGIADTVALARSDLLAFESRSRSRSVTRESLDAALDALSEGLQDRPDSPSKIAARLSELLVYADSMVYLTKALGEECPDRASVGADALAAMEAVRAALRTHQRDLEHLVPWASHVATDTTLLAEPDTAEGGLSPAGLNTMPTLADVPRRCDRVIRLLTRRRAAVSDDAASNGEQLAKIDALIEVHARSAAAVAAFKQRLNALRERTRRIFDAMAFDFLFNQERQLFSIGYRVADNSLDPNCYDLLASEARLLSFIAIARGDAPTRHWFRLGRTLTPVAHGSALISWSGSMFEYLMPSLVMRVPTGSLIYQSNRFAVRRQIDYGTERGVPWGISESAYNTRDLDLTYQYLSFGVPDLGLKRGLGENTVIAPYATALAAMVDPRAALRNFAGIAAAGGSGRYGWYEALDYTPARLPVGEKVAVVRAYMAHHQGMSLVAIANVLQDGLMRSRFHAEPMMQATELLLQERTPRDVAIALPRDEGLVTTSEIRDLVPATQRRFNSPHASIPRTHLLSNGRYAVMLTSAGSGYSRRDEIAVTRWREDVTCDAWGSYVFLRDIDDGTVWSAGYQPSGAEPDSYEVLFSEGRAEIIRRDGSISTTLEVAVSREDDAEIRRVSIANRGKRARDIELTSYAEIVLAPEVADSAHPAFSKMFVETEFVASSGTLLATRRPRSPDDRQVWAAHLAVVEGQSIGDLQFETDRARFLGRGRTIRAPAAVLDGWPLSNSAGTVLDPIFSLRCRVHLPPGATARVAYWTLLSSSRLEALDMADKHRDAMAYERVMTLAWTQAQVQLHHLGISADEAHLFQRLANRVLYSDPSLRPSADVLAKGGREVSTLWTKGISGDLPIVLVRVEESEDLEIVRQLLRAQEYWQMKQLAVDLVILNEKAASYVQDFQSSLETMVRATQPQPEPAAKARGMAFVLRSDLISPELLGLLQTAARAVLIGRRGSLAEQVKRLPDAKPETSPPTKPASSEAASHSPRPDPGLEFFNGLGGFAASGREYVTILEAGQTTPAPWLNVVANPSFGFHVSTDGGGGSWSINSQQNQLTPWSNDPVSDTPGEVIYVADTDSGEIWGPTALPIREASPYIARHGQGYSRFEHVSREISLELLQYVPLRDPIKISRLTIANQSKRVRHLSVTAYVQWVLGATRGPSSRYVMTGLDEASGALLARNPWSAEFGHRVAFADLRGRQTSWTGDRMEFIGRNGTLDHPAALVGDRPLSNRLGAGFDPCGALQTRLELQPGEASEITVLLGETADLGETQALLARYRTVDLDAVLAEVTQFWDDTLGVVQVKTPDRAMDVMLGGWLLYQALVCRVWARAGFYQASGAYGFRDQLQDVMALCVSRPELTREHLLRAAARQFVEGDVQHWWLPESGRGVRTRVSDDHLWLPYVAAHYVVVTGDLGVLDEIVPFITGPALKDGEHDAFFLPTISEERATLFEHCARSLDRSLGVGEHGLPLFGGGDWNDGMNRVGEGGKGESTWLGWFLHATISAFAPVAAHRGDTARSDTWQHHGAALKVSLDRQAWDGDWYRRGYFDDGTPLGSVTSSECRIDSIAQSWAVISGAATPGRAARAMAALDKYLVRREDGMILLFTPPFDQTTHDPGYIKGYPPGLRENGGQYTHAAVWSVIALAMQGDGDRAGELFSMLSPIHHTSTRSAVHRYKVEPYVACADIYSAHAHVGRGGWTWYTGSAGWMYRAGLEWILGFRQRGPSLLIDPCIPKAWPGFEIAFRHRSARYDIVVENPSGVSRGVIRTELDGAALSGEPGAVPLADDGAIHRVRIVLGHDDVSHRPAAVELAVGS
jgi:cyclic beta-1,2-glucan synthetase